LSQVKGDRDHGSKEGAACQRFVCKQNQIAPEIMKLTDFKIKDTFYKYVAIAAYNVIKKEN
jgi:hypothetical protein